MAGRETRRMQCPDCDTRMKPTKHEHNESLIRYDCPNCYFIHRSRLKHDRI